MFLSDAPWVYCPISFLPRHIYMLQMSEIRKALDLMKRVERLEDKGARRLALELGTVACERGEQQARSSSAKLESEGETKQEQHC